MISHGYEVKEKDDPFVTLADHATEQFALSTAPGGFMVDVIPIRTCRFTPLSGSVTNVFSTVRHVPEWLPGAGFKKKASAWRSTLAKMVEGPHHFVKQQMVNHFWR